ncbi:Ectonucleoside triphosphate diphosphohydrolase 5 [Camelus dromedarius]|uniref:nucleoside diphosphate phosphatase n=1 Tax=Camelus dromedarius TaxID=9838 RepID=A0A5N4E1G2_CAMDR|nr:Ectonucleoside triphosphate diphosphohydrolase 5 [Camelus dromedarius]
MKVDEPDNHVYLEKRLIYMTNLVAAKESAKRSDLRCVNKKASWSNLVYLCPISHCSTVFHRDQQTWFEGVFLSSMCPVNVSASTLYGIMFDAGSTGTRIHVYTFVQKIPGQLPFLEGEIFDSVKPGLSAFVDQPKQGAESVQELLEVAKDSIPRSHWKRTPVVLKATAGLRLLPEEKAQALLFEVKEIFKKSPFLVPDDSVSIMDGSYEGQLHSHSQETVGTLDLGGASTQITFLPQFELASHVLTLFLCTFAPAGAVGFEPCYAEVLRVVQGKLHQPDEVQRSSFYAFSYYYDRAVDTDMIVCDNLENFTSGSPFLCMDLSYITALLKDGFGFAGSTILQLTKKVNNIETGWALGATFHLLQSLGISH